MAIEVLGAVLGAVLVLFVPGLAVSTALFKQGEIDFIERITLSFALSIALVPLLLFYLNFGLGMKINLANAVLVVLAIVLASCLAWAWRTGRLGRIFRRENSFYTRRF